MATVHRITAWCGSLRENSYNRKLLRVAASYLESRGVQVDWVDLKSPMFPLYDEDRLENDPPPEVAELKARVAAAAGMVVASPEYNHSIPGGLKNAIDWLSRPPQSQPFRGRVVALLGASTGLVGTARGQPHLRESLLALGVHLVPPGGFLLPNAAEAFADDGSLVDARKAKTLHSYLDVLLADLDLRSRTPIG
jgi:chromate reductase